MHLSRNCSKTKRPRRCVERNVYEASMKPPADRQLDHAGRGHRRPHRRTAALRRALAVRLPGGHRCSATLSSALAWQFTQSLGKARPVLRTLSCSTAATGTSGRSSRPRSCGCRSISGSSARASSARSPCTCPRSSLFSLAHIAAMSGVQWWLARRPARPFHWWTEAQRRPRSRTSTGR